MKSHREVVLLLLTASVIEQLVSLTVQLYVIPWKKANFAFQRANTFEEEISSSFHQSKEGVEAWDIAELEEALLNPSVYFDSLRKTATIQ